MSDLGVIVHGGGPAALMATLALAEAGVPVTLLGPRRAVDWPTLPCGGVDDGSDPEAAASEAWRAGGERAPRTALRALAAEAEELVRLLGQLGVPWQRDARGELVRRQLDGMRSARALFVQDDTARHVARALHRALLGGWSRTPVIAAPAAAGVESGARAGSSLERREIAIKSHHQLVELALRGDRVVGMVVEDVATGELEPIAARAVVLAGGPWRLGSRSPSVPCCEGALAAALRAGARYAAAEAVQPWLAVRTPGGDVLLSPSLLAEGARPWLPEEPGDVRRARDIPRAERRHFLDEAHPGWGARVPADLVAAAILAEHRAGRGIYSRRRDDQELGAWLDLSHLPAGHLRERLGGRIDAIAAATGTDPTRDPLPVRPVWRENLGGLWVGLDDSPGGAEQQTDVAGLYAVGPAALGLHGACRAGGLGLLGELWSARSAAAAIARHEARGPGDDAVRTALDEALARAEAADEEREARDGVEIAAALHAELYDALERGAGQPSTKSAARLLEDVAELTERLAQCAASPRAHRELEDMLLLAEVVAGAVAERARLDAAGQGRRVTLAELCDGEVRFVEDERAVAAGDAPDRSYSDSDLDSHPDPDAETKTERRGGVHPRPPGDDTEAP